MAELHEAASREIEEEEKKKKRRAAISEASKSDIKVGLGGANKDSSKLTVISGATTNNNVSATDIAADKANLP
jgi:formiminotetrahydrofolate cyclodeaminase